MGSFLGKGIYGLVIFFSFKNAILMKDMQWKKVHEKDGKEEWKLWTNIHSQKSFMYAITPVSHKSALYYWQPLESFMNIENIWVACEYCLAAYLTAGYTVHMIYSTKHLPL